MSRPAAPTPNTAGNPESAEALAKHRRRLLEQSAVIASVLIGEQFGMDTSPIWEAAVYQYGTTGACPFDIERDTVLVSLVEVAVTLTDRLVDEGDLEVITVQEILEAVEGDLINDDMSSYLDELASIRAWSRDSWDSGATIHLSRDRLAYVGAQILTIKADLTGVDPLLLLNEAMGVVIKNQRILHELHQFVTV